MSGHFEKDSVFLPGWPNFLFRGKARKLLGGFICVIGRFVDENGHVAERFRRRCYP